jgi:biopolymer transport protein ExbD
MRFQRQARIFRGQFDVAPYVGVLFLVVLFLLLHSSLVFRPGVKIELPTAGELPGPDRPALVVAIDHNGQLYFEHQIIPESQFQARLNVAVRHAHQPMTLVVEADGRVNQSQVVRISEMARQAGIQDLWLATRPRSFDTSPTQPPASGRK